MRCEAARRALSEALDDGLRRSLRVQRHLRRCSACRQFRAGLLRLRELARDLPAPPPPDLAPAVMARIREELGAVRPVAARRGRVGAPPPTWRAVTASVAVGLVVGFVLTAGGLVPVRQVDLAALAQEIPRLLVETAVSLEGYRATFEVTERNWTRTVRERRFLVDMAFRAPEALRVEVRDLTAYPSAAWPRNDLLLVTDGRRWLASGPDPCPPPALPACPSGGPVQRFVVGRPPFHAESSAPTDLIVPMTVLAAQDRVEVVGPGRVEVMGPGPAAARDAVVVQLEFRDASPLFQSFSFLGSWRPFFPHDPVLVWLDRETWFPLRFEVFPQPGPSRAQWASQLALPREDPARPLLQAVVRTLSEAAPPAHLFAVHPGPRATDLGFRDVPVGRLVRGGEAPPLPRDTAGLEVWRAGRFVSPRPFRQSVVAFADGLGWLTVTRVTGWDRRAPFGVGPLAEPVALANGVGYYEPATATSPRRVALHTAAGELLVAGSLPRASLLRVAGSIPVQTRRLPRAWLVRRWPGGVVRSGLWPGEAVRAVPFETLVPATLPPGYAPAVAEVAEGPRVSGLTLVFRRPAAELDGDGLRLYQAAGQGLSPPTEPGAQAVELRGTVGRWLPDAQVLEWVEDGVYRSLSGAGFDLPTLLHLAASLHPAGGPR